MTGVTTGQYVMSRLPGYQHLKPWQRIILTRSIALIPSVSVALASLGQQSTLDATSQAVNVVMSVLIPFAILPLLHFTSSGRLMGTFVNSGWMMAVGWGFAVLVMGINFYLVIVTLQNAGVSGGVWVGFSMAAVLYVCMVAVLVKDEARMVLQWMRGKVALFRSRQQRAAQSTAASEVNGRDGTEEATQPGEPVEGEAAEQKSVERWERVDDEKVREADGDTDGAGVELTASTWK